MTPHRPRRRHPRGAVALRVIATVLGLAAGAFGSLFAPAATRSTGASAVTIVLFCLLHLLWWVRLRLTP